MRTTIDRAGRLVIPKQLRVALGLIDGQELEITARDGRLEIEPAPIAIHLARRGRHTVAVPDVDLPPLTAQMVRETLEQIRR